MYNPPVNISDNHWYKKIHNALPAFMNQDPDSNNQKMLDIYTDFGNQYKNDVLDMTDQLLINHASGQALDQICNDWGVAIIDENDDNFKRFQLRFQIMSRRLSPSHIKDAIAFIFNIPTSEFNVEATNTKEIKVTDLPFDFKSGDKSSIKRTLITKYIRDMLPPEFELKEVDYQAYADIHIYLDNVTPAPPMFINARQHYGTMKENAATFLNYHAESINMINATQHRGTLKEDTSSYLGFHAESTNLINAIQENRSDK